MIMTVLYSICSVILESMQSPDGQQVVVFKVDVSVLKKNTFSYLVLILETLEIRDNRNMSIRIEVLVLIVFRSSLFVRTFSQVVV